MGKAAEFLRKAVDALRGKAIVLRVRLLFLASPQRRMAVLAGISRHIRALTLTQRQEKAAAAAQCRRGTAVAPPAEDDDDEHVFGLPELARLFEQEGDERRRAGGGGGFAVVDGGLDADEEEEEASVIDVIRRRQEGDGVEFRMEEEIDEAADMYIARRVRRRIIVNYAHTELKLSTLSGIE
ncbi:unnamed protein product [Urochloa decumbens]|uniref:Uncharacterized protein n=1 Tax=Urochloa decumbens TaxID=240449 RepID=A0ABC9BJD9_9POAL